MSAWRLVADEQSAMCISVRVASAFRLSTSVGYNTDVT